MQTATTTFTISNSVSLHTYYDRPFRCWWAYYTCRVTGDQIGDGWHAATRDDVLIFRPRLRDDRDYRFAMSGDN